ncbi:respiratory nitrite reductase-specific menaquinol--cytochrome-c reductase complex subunit NrfD [Nonomuraea polychroma]|uniref:Respiratory nitrite reductase-specific menaquinol--cytochrome-c reductase complex subunit NrfD n=1 Tax=Nonomuraea polychroma TaxID=46176 RepID=A0A438M1U0_9ACTN|nr:NrfD/PsrC family molybdoenzyme membrane anchor subunit [Nonomuraea polychroma]RVX39796.1 respiratory nitrite reductase-specific menaquinol--cytochrome-c reductase complex subunit NrfD [Nonomuraea polychroma]
MTLGDPLPETPWGAPLGAYFVLVGMPSGLTVISWWARTRRYPGWAAVERVGSWVALGVLAVVSVILVVDLGRPAGFFLMLTRFDNLGSPISVGAKLIAVKMFLLAVLLYQLERRRRADRSASARTLPRWIRTVPAWLLIALSFGLAIYPVSVLSRSWGSPLAATSGAALIFLLTSLLMGAAGAVLIVELMPHVDSARSVSRAGMATLLGGYLLALIFEGLSLNGDPLQRRLLAEVVAGAYALPFWGLVVAVGVATPTACLLLSRRRAAVMVSALAILVGAAAVRYLIFLAG